MSQYLYGRKPHTPDDRDLEWGKVAKPEVAVHVPFGHGNDYWGQGWMMNGNGPPLPGEEPLPSSWSAARGGAGDCVYASWVNEVKEALVDALGWPCDTAGVLRKVGAAKTAITGYARDTGYDPVSGANDNGQEVRTRLQIAQKLGLTLADGTVHKIGPYYKVDFTNIQDLTSALYYAEAVVLGLKVQAANEEAFNEAEQTGKLPPVWDYVPGSEVVGLHCIPIVGRPNEGDWTTVNWTRRMLLTEAFRQHNIEEAWCYITQDRISAVTGKTYEGVDPAQVEAYIAQVAHREG